MDRRRFLTISSGAMLKFVSNSAFSSSENIPSDKKTYTNTGEIKQIVKDVWLIKDSCNVYIIKKGNRAVAVDFGSGRWFEKLSRFGIHHLDHVFLTHHHADQCAGLQRGFSGQFEVHAPTGEEKFLDPDQRKEELTTERLQRGCPESYSVTEKGIDGIKYDIRGFSNMYWGGDKIRFMHTPGHGPNACSIIMTHGSQQIVFCGDAAYEGSTIWHPFNLEWDHWTGKGALAAWQGINQLSDIRIDVLCPSHGPVMFENPHENLVRLKQKLMNFYSVKNSISPLEKDNFLTPEEFLIDGNVRRVLPNLYQFGSNGYLLVSSNGEGLIIDPFKSDLEILEQLLQLKREIRITAATSSHYHFDHSDGMNDMRTRYHAKSVLHPLVAEPLLDITQSYVPWLPAESTVTDEFWPTEGLWRWNEYEFKVAHAPGQTWWHCVFMTNIDGKSVCFTGDSFQPNTRWNGTGGFCAYNNSRFSNGFIPTSQKILSWDPDILAAGHASFFSYSTTKFEKIIAWAQHAEEAVTALCPNNDSETQYYSLGVSSNNNITQKPDISILRDELYGW
ncbi:MBL fold metallo-hydrolase [Candidatus Omnitrophota bacterium]